MDVVTLILKLHKCNANLINFNKIHVLFYAFLIIFLINKNIGDFFL